MSHGGPRKSPGSSFLSLCILAWAPCAFKSSISSMTSSTMWAFPEAPKTHCILEGLLLLSSLKLKLSLLYAQAQKFKLQSATVLSTSKTCKKVPFEAGKWFGALGWARFSWCSLLEALEFSRSQNSHYLMLRTVQIWYAIL